MLAAYQDQDPVHFPSLARELGRAISVHVYVDTGMRRLGIPAHRAGAWLEELDSPAVNIEGTFMGLTEEDDFDAVQLARFRTLTAGARDAGIDLGRLHAASSHAIFVRPEAHLEMVRPVR